MGTQINLPSNWYPVHIYLDEQGTPEVSFFFGIYVIIIVIVISPLALARSYSGGQLLSSVHHYNHGSLNQTLGAKASI